MPIPQTKRWLWSKTRKVIHPGAVHLMSYRSVRRLVTGNFSSGLLAVGERNSYGFHPRWVTIDMAGADFEMNLRSRKPFPFPENSQEMVYSSHMIEHLDDDTLDFFLKEAHRVLLPSGYLRLEAPDAKILHDAYLRNDTQFWRPFCDDNHKVLVEGLGMSKEYSTQHVTFLGMFSCYIDHRQTHIPVIASRDEVDQKVRSLSLDDFLSWAVSLQSKEQKPSGGHVNAIYFEKLKCMLERVGFGTVYRVNCGETLAPNLSLRGVERTHRAGYSIFLEAAKSIFNCKRRQ